MTWPSCVEVASQQWLAWARGGAGGYGAEAKPPARQHG